MKFEPEVTRCQVCGDSTDEAVACDARGCSHHYVCGNCDQAIKDAHYCPSHYLPALAARLLGMAEAA